MGRRLCLPCVLEGLPVARFEGEAFLAAVLGIVFLVPDLGAVLAVGLEAAFAAGLALRFALGFTAGFAAGFEPAFADDLEAVLGAGVRADFAGDLVTGFLEVTFLRLGIRREG